MPDRPPPTSPLRQRAPDPAADLGLYAAPLALGVPVMLAASDAAPVLAAAAPSAASGQAQAHAAKSPPAFGWWSDPDGKSGASASIGPATGPPGTSMAGDKADQAGDGAAKVVVVHDTAGLPPAMPPLTHIDPVARTDSAAAPAAAPPADPAAASAAAASAVDPAGQAALNAIGALAEGTVGQATEAVGALVIDAAGLADGVLEAANMLVAETVDGLGDLVADLGALGGTDPLAGIATLVEMVGSADLLGLTDIAAPADGLLVSLGGVGDALGEPLDLIAAPPADPLLGVTENGHGPLGLLAGLTDDLI